MPIVTSPLTAPQSSPFAIIEDIALRGSYRAVAIEQDMLSLNPSFCKEGMLVNCLDTGKTYTLAKLDSSFDEFGDPVAEMSWLELKFSTTNTDNSKRALARWSMEVETEMESGVEVSFTLNLAKVILVNEIVVNALCAIEFSESNNAIILDDFSTFNHKINYEFKDLNKLRYGTRYELPDGTPLNTRYTNFFVNKDPVTDVNFYFKVKNTGTSYQAITTKFSFIALHTS